MESSLALERFLAGVEQRAYRMALFATGSRDDALDIAQDAMFKLVRRYRSREASEWGPLFHRILQTTIRDWHRRRSVRNKVRGWFSRDTDEDSHAPWEDTPAPPSAEPTERLAAHQSMDRLQHAIGQLPLRQQQALLLRVWEGFDVAQTAQAMGCSQGSVKTHYSRAVHTLRELLEDYRL